MAILFRTGLEFLGYTGGIFVLYGAYVAIWGPPWPPLERIALPASSFLTILGAGITAGSVYFHHVPPTPPEKKSRYVTAPLVIVASTIALLALVTKTPVPAVTVNGFAMLGISGALFRLQPRPSQD